MPGYAEAHESGWCPASPPLTAAAFAGAVAGHPMLVVHFWAVWDVYDRTMDAVLTKVAGEFGTEVTVRSFEVDQGDSTLVLNELELLTVPALICFVRGARHERLGLLAEERLRARFGAWTEASAA